MEDLIQKNDWDIDPESYQQDNNGEFILKRDGTPKRKGGRPKGKPSRGYNLHSATKAKISARRSLRDKEKRLDSLEKKVKKARVKVKKQRDVQQKLDESPDKETPSGKLITREDLERVLPDAVKKTVTKNTLSFRRMMGHRLSS